MTSTIKQLIELDKETNSEQVIAAVQEKLVEMPQNGSLKPGRPKPTPSVETEEAAS